MPFQSFMNIKCFINLRIIHSKYYFIRQIYYNFFQKLNKKLAIKCVCCPFYCKNAIFWHHYSKAHIECLGVCSINWVGCFASSSIKPIVMRRISELIEVNNGKTSIPYSAGNSECSRWLVFHTCGIVVLIPSWQFTCSSF